MDITHWSATLKDKSRIASPNLLGEESYHISSKVSGTWLAQIIRSIFWLLESRYRTKFQKVGHISAQDNFFHSCVAELSPQILNQKFTHANFNFWLM